MVLLLKLAALGPATGHFGGRVRPKVEGRIKVITDQGVFTPLKLET
jgi:hypothetical protein